MNRPIPLRFSIITPVFNREDCIERCIESVINQEYDNIEMWIIDDGSTDKTSEIIAKYAENYSFIIHHKFPENKGVNAARNYGIKKSKSDFTIFLDSDDYFAENALLAISDTIAENPEYGHFLFAQDDRVEYYQSNNLLSEKKAIIHFSDFLLEKVCGDFTHVIKTGILKKYPFDEFLRIYEIVSFFQVFRESGKLLFTNHIVVNRERDRSDSVSLEYIKSDFHTLSRKKTAIDLQLEYFMDDFLKFDKEGNIIEKLACKGYLYSIATGQKNISYFTEYLSQWQKSIPVYYKILRLIPPFYIRFLLNLYTKSKILISK